MEWSWVAELVAQVGLGAGAILTLRKRLDRSDARLDQHEETLVDHEHRLVKGRL